MMLRYFLISCCLGLTLAKTQNYSLCFKGKDNAGNTCMAVETNDVINSIYYHIEESDEFEDVETLEDYSVGLAASRVVSQEACYVRRLMKSFESQVSYLKTHNQKSAARTEEDMKVDAIALDNPEEEIGADLTNFCGDLPIYKLVKKQEEEEEEEEVSQEVEERDTDRRRQVTVSFTRCVLLCFIPRCFTTTLTLPTGSTITFGWFFFG